MKSNARILNVGEDGGIVPASMPGGYRERMVAIFDKIAPGVRKAFNIMGEFDAQEINWNIDDEIEVIIRRKERP